MPRKTRRQLIGKEEDIEREEREDALRALKSELRQAHIQKSDDLLPEIIEPAEEIKSLFQAIEMPLTVHTRT
jgi:hypothetical protein